MPTCLIFEHGRAHYRRELLLLHFAVDTAHGRRAATPGTREVVSARLLSNELVTGRGHRIQSMLLNASRRCVQGRAHLRRAAVAAWSRRLAHFLHLPEVTESLRGGIETVVRIVLQEVQRLLVDHGLSVHHAVGHGLLRRHVVLESEAEGRLGGSLVN